MIGLGILGIALSCWGYVQGGSLIAPILALAGLLAFLIYAYWYSSFNRRSSAQLLVGKTLPAFELTDIAGHSISSASLTDKPAVWIFFRGNWCPLCMSQIKEVARQYQQLQELGVRVALISPQPHKFRIGLARKFSVPFDFLRDEGNRAARSLLRQSGYLASTRIFIVSALTPSAAAAATPSSDVNILLSASMSVTAMTSPVRFGSSSLRKACTCAAPFASNNLCRLSSPRHAAIHFSASSTSCEIIRCVLGPSAASILPSLL
ncbi:MAG: redoxin domain-containing protein [Gammaproteobacteria bacterium]|nr:redoxin domain-containing protein [Gammaproteobacteria bacterium]